VKVGEQSPYNVGNEFYFAELVVSFARLAETSPQHCIE